MYAAWHQWCTEANEATRTHCYNPVAPAYPICAYYAHGWQRRCQEDRVSLLSGRLEKTTRSSPHHVAQHRPTGSETTPPYAPQSSRFGSELNSVEDDVDVWRYAIMSCMPETTNDGCCAWCQSHVIYYRCNNCCKLTTQPLHKLQITIISEPNRVFWTKLNRTKLILNCIQVFRKVNRNQTE